MSDPSVSPLANSANSLSDATGPGAKICAAPIRTRSDRQVPLPLVIGRTTDKSEPRCAAKLALPSKTAAPGWIRAECKRVGKLLEFGQCVTFPSRRAAVGQLHPPLY